MSAWLALAMLWQAWWLAATAPSAEHVEVTVTDSSGESTASDYSTWFSPAPFDLRLAIGPLAIEADQTGIWAAHRQDPSTVALLSQDPVRSPDDLADFLPPTPTPTASLAAARPTRPWAPLPSIQGVRWQRMSVIVSGSRPIGARLIGTSERGEIHAVIHRGRLQTLTLKIPESGRVGAVASIRVDLDPADPASPLAIDRSVSRVGSLFSLKALGPPIVPGQRLPRGIQLADDQGSGRLEDLDWPTDSGLRLIVFVPAASIEHQASTLRLVDEAIASAISAQSTRITPIALVDGRGTVEAGQRVRGLVDAIGATRVLRGVYALNEQHRLLYRLRPQGEDEGPVGALVDADGVVRAVVVLDGPAEAAASALIESLRSDPARGR